MRKIAFLLILCIVTSACSGCAWVGRTAGKAQAKIERKANDLEEGYNQGYGDEKNKTSSEQQDS